MFKMQNQDLYKLQQSFYIFINKVYLNLYKSINTSRLDSSSDSFLKISRDLFKTSIESSILFYEK